MRLSLALGSVVLGIGWATSATAADLNLKLQIPQLEVAEYHRPYVAVWIEREDQSIAGNLAVWYQTDKKKEEIGRAHV